MTPRSCCTAAGILLEVPVVLLAGPQLAEQRRCLCALATPKLTGNPSAYAADTAFRIASIAALALELRGGPRRPDG